MGEMKVVLSDELEEKFREEVFKSKGMKKGNLSKSVQEAIEMWIEAQPHEEGEGAEEEDAEEEGKSWKVSKSD